MRGLIMMSFESLVHLPHRRGLSPTLRKTRSNQTQAGSLDDSLQTITKLESAADGGKGAVPLKEQNEGREKLQVGDGAREELNFLRAERALS